MILLHSCRSHRSSIPLLRNNDGGDRKTKIRIGILLIQAFKLIRIFHHLQELSIKKELLLSTIINMPYIYRPLSTIHLSPINHSHSLIMAVTGRRVPGVFPHCSSPLISLHTDLCQSPLTLKHKLIEQSCPGGLLSAPRTAPQLHSLFGIPLGRFSTKDSARRGLCCVLFSDSSAAFAASIKG